MKSQRTEIWKGLIRRTQKQIDLSECHPSWGKKRIVKIERAIIRKEEAIRKRRK
jgi:hypothetical protein